MSLYMSVTALLLGKKNKNKQKQHNSYLTFAEKEVLQEIFFPPFISYSIYKQNAITERSKKVIL